MFFIQIVDSYHAVTPFFCPNMSAKSCWQLGLRKLLSNFVIFAVCDEDEQTNDGSEYKLSIDGKGKNCNMLLRLDASDSDVCPIQNFAFLKQFLLSQ